jgi:hypothetical protein
LVAVIGQARVVAVQVVMVAVEELVAVAVVAELAVALDSAV